MTEMVRKITLSRAVRTMQDLFPLEYNFYPRSWILPEELPLFVAEVDRVYSHSSMTCWVLLPFHSLGVFYTYQTDSFKSHSGATDDIFLNLPEIRQSLGELLLFVMFWNNLTNNCAHVVLSSHLFESLVGLLLCLSIQNVIKGHSFADFFFKVMLCVSVWFCYYEYI